MYRRVEGVIEELLQRIANLTRGRRGGQSRYPFQVDAGPCRDKKGERDRDGRVIYLNNPVVGGVP